MVDPVPLDAARLAFARKRGGAAFVLVTNADHWRATDQAKDAFGAHVIAPSGERERLGDRAARVDTWLATSADLPEPLRETIEPFFLRGGKSPVELALHLKRQKALLFGDLVRSRVSGKLTLLPDGKLADKPLALESLRPLLSRPFDAVLLGDGDCVFTGGRDALFGMLDDMPGILFNRMNLDRLEFVPTARHPRAATAFAEVSRAMTCRGLGFHAQRLLPGMIWPAFHYESAEEEMFLVRKGRMKVRTPQGTFVLEPGDLIALPALPSFAHQFSNDFDEPCEFLALSNIAKGNVTTYPEGNRIALGDRGEMYRIADQRKDYWEDEPAIR